MWAHLDGRELWPYVVLLSETFARALMGLGPTKVIENLPSQMGKTTGLMDDALWALDFDPRLRVMYVTYDVNKAEELGGDCRDLAEVHSADLRFRLRKDRSAKGQWKTDQGGGMYCTGINGAITGYPADVLLLDDLFKGWETAHSETQREHAWAIYRSQCRLRIQGPHCPVINAGTRWHRDDITGKLLDAALADPAADQWHHIRLPAIAEAPDPLNVDPSLRTPDPLGRAPGELLEARRFPEEEVKARQVVLGSYLWAAMEQQRPAPEEGNIVKRAWFRLEAQLPPHADEWISSWDLKLKDKEEGDFVVGQVWARTGGDMWLCDQLRGKWGQEKTILAIALLQVRWPQVNAHHVEWAGNAPEVMKALRQAAPAYVVSDDDADELGMTQTERALVQELRRHGLPGLLGNPVKGDKAVRLRAQVPYIEAGNVHVLETASWLPGYLDEMAAFPNGSHADQVDATSQALLKLAKGPATAGPPPAGPLPNRPHTGPGLAAAPSLRGGGALGSPARSGPRRVR
jgi:predicted phage terminase large subunit-like protein